MFNSDRLRQLRKQHGLTQTEMGHRLNMEQPTYLRYEKGIAELNLSMLQKLHDEFDVDPSEFIVTKSNVVHFENGSTNNGNGIVQADNYYTFPKEIIDTLIPTINSQNELLTQLKNIISKQK